MVVSFSKNLIAIIFLFFCQSGALHASPLQHCAALASCVDGRALCVLVEMPKSTMARWLKSEAYGDFAYQFDRMRAQGRNVKLFMINNIDFAFSGFPKRAGERTIFINSNKALLFEGLYVDDTSIIEEYYFNNRPEFIRNTGFFQVVKLFNKRCNKKFAAYQM